MNQLNFFFLLKFALLQKQLTVMYSSILTTVWNSDLFDGLMFIDCTWCARCCKEHTNDPIPHLLCSGMT